MTLCPHEPSETRLKELPRQATPTSSGRVQISCGQDQPEFVFALQDFCGFIITDAVARSLCGIRLGDVDGQLSGCLVMHHFLSRCESFDSRVAVPRYGERLKLLLLSMSRVYICTCAAPEHKNRLPCALPFLH